MTKAQAKRLYTTVARRINGFIESYDNDEWTEIADEMRHVVEAPSDRRAADVIRWWDGWDRGCTATRFARELRKEWQEMLRRKKAKWSDAWCGAYRSRAGRYGHTMPEREQRKMTRALNRMRAADKREKARA